MRLAEEKIINKTSAEEIKKIEPATSVTEQIQTGYLKKGTVLGIKTTKNEYQAELVNKAYPSIRIYPGKALTFWVDFKNTGTKTWSNSNEHFMALNVTEPAGRESPFKHEYWQEYYYRPCRLSNSEVEPGEIVCLDKNGLSSRFFVNPDFIRPAHCIFEHIYFAKQNSVIDP